MFELYGNGAELRSKNGVAETRTNVRVVRMYKYQGVISWRSREGQSRYISLGSIVESLQNQSG